MAYNEKQKQARRCRWIKNDGSRCRAYSKLNSEHCSLHSYDHKAKKLPKAGERAAARARRAKRQAQPQRRAVCNCSMLPYPHRFNSTGACPDAPVVARKAADDDVERAYERSGEVGALNEERGRRSTSNVGDEPRHQHNDPLTQERANAYVEALERTWSSIPEIVNPLWETN